MLLTITNQTAPALDLGYLLHKHPGKAQSMDLSFGRAQVFYPEASDDICTMALMLSVDPVALSRGQHGPGEAVLEPYVNDRPYVASSFLSVALSRFLGTALHGRCEKRPELVARPLALRARLSVLPCRGGETLLRQLWEPLGYEVTATRHALDPRFPAWGDSSYYTVELSATRPLRELLSHLYVLVPVLDDKKHYYVGDDEVAKLLAMGEGWLASHPSKDLITRRYLKHRYRLASQALAQLEVAEPDVDLVDEPAVKAPRLVDERMAVVLATLVESGAQSVLDLGCGEGRLLRLLWKEKSFKQIVGMDVSSQSLGHAAENLRLAELPERHKDRLTLLHGSLLYRDARLANFDAAAVVEVIEHLPAARLAAFERVLFEFARPRTIVLTTPNVEYNVHYPNLAPGQFRHRDHQFEWTRPEFQAWANTVANRYGYTVRFDSIGPADPDHGPPTQMGVFRRE